ncbi:MAG TPA: uroporphyrinogen-III synthase [Acidimicrobiales bacterium]|nr:uroporphyrinogen-III synthase [Acidimicrobiales bacterium]
MPLEEMTGFVVGVTADRRADEQIAMLERRGAAVLHGPALRTHPVAVDGPLADALDDLIARPPEVTVLSTGIGVRGVVEAAEVLGRAEALVEALGRSRVFARGPKAHGAAVTAGIPVHWSTPSGVSAEIVDELARTGVAGVRVAVQLDGARTQPLAETLVALGADVVPMPIYRWSLPEDVGPAVRLIHAVADRRVDAVTFTARPGIESLCEIAETEGLLDRLRAGFARGVVVACVGPVCADAAVEAGFGQPVVPVRPRLGSMVVTVAEALSHRSITFRLGDDTVRLQGRIVRLAGETVQVSERERDLLAALARRPGAVLSKADLLTVVWPEGDADEHAVEVAVARLRRRLGPYGHLLETVFRRGYRFAT